MSHIPGRLVGHPEVPPKLAGGYALLGIAHQRDRGEPFRQRQMRIVKQGASQGAELELAGCALKQPARATGLVLRLDRPTLVVIASQTPNSAWPTRPDQMLNCVFFSGKLTRQSIQIHR